MGYLPVIFIFFTTVLIAYFNRRTRCRTVQIKLGDIPLFSSFSGLGIILALALPIVVLLSLRYGIGTDYFNYENVYNQIIAGEVYDEIAFAWLMKLSYYIFGDYEGAVMITSAITGLLWMTWLFKVTEEKENLPMAVFILLTLYIGAWFNTIQQAISSGIIALAYLSIKQGKTIRFYLLVLIAGMVHMSAVIILPFYFFYTKKTDRLNSIKSKKKRIKKIIFLLIICVALFGLYYTYANSHEIMYAHYILDTYEGGRIKEFFYYQLLFYIPELIFMPRLLEKKEENSLYYIMIFLEAIVFLASFRIAYAFRMAEYFSLAHVVIVPQILVNIKSNRNKKLLTLYFIGITSWYTVYMHVINSFDHIFPYESIF